MKLRGGKMESSSRVEIKVFESFLSFQVKLFNLTTGQRNQFYRGLSSKENRNVFIGNYASITDETKIVIGFEARTGNKEKTEEKIRLIEMFCNKFNLRFQKSIFEISSDEDYHTDTKTKALAQS